MHDRPMPRQVQPREGAATHRGQVRPRNEDSLGTPQSMEIGAAQQAQKGALFAVADGMGGHAAGEVASQRAIEVLFHVYYGDPSPSIEESLRSAFQAANADVQAMAAAEPDKQGMGTTLVAAVLKEGELFVANVGDSRTYLWRDGHLRQLTHDHSVPGALLAAGKIKPGDVYTHEQRHLLYRCLGHKPVVEPDVFQPLALRPGDALLLCSDGLWEELRTSGIAEVMASEPDVTLAAARMVDAANEAGGEDNITVVVVRVRE